MDNGLVEVFHCLNENFDPYTYEGEDYYSPGNYDLLYPGMGVAECDSMAVLQLTMVGVDAFIELTCAGSDFVLVPLIQEMVPSNANIDWSWYESGSGIVISNDSTLHTTEDGCYDLFATIDVPEGECTMQIGGSSFCFEGNQYLPDAPEVNSDTIICAQPGVLFEVSNIPGGEQYTYVWSAPSDVPEFQNDSNVVVMDFTNSIGGEVCVYAIGSCGVSPSSCFNVITVNNLEVPVINCTSTIISILFDWNDISGANEYQISLDHNAPFSIDVSEYLVQPL
ncbi:MAG TPA: hypothetical protein VMZ69_07910, partial [Saprospiraceae bacterium]|nr:hypothetical protein [Saprospiraceae bacterium]